MKIARCHMYEDSNAFGFKLFCGVSTTIYLGACCNCLCWQAIVGESSPGEDSQQREVPSHGAGHMWNLIGVNSCPEPS
eukprot:3032881-Amphidinium_carterae.1